MQEKPFKRSLILVWLLVVGMALWLIVSQMQMTTRVTQFMPEAKSELDQLLFDQLNEGSNTRLWLMAIKGADSVVLKDLSQRFVSQLRLSNQFRFVFNGKKVFDKKTADLLFRYRYLLTDQASNHVFEQHSLSSIFRQRQRELASPLVSFDKKHFSQDPTNAYLDLFKSYQRTGNDHAHLDADVWMSDDGKMALLIAETAIEGFDIDGQQRLLNDVRQTFSRLAADSSASLQLSGPSIIAVDMSEKIQAEVTTLSILASVFVIALLIAVYRSLRLVILNILPLMTAMILATATTLLVFGYIHGITLAFGITILGVAIDYSIHVFSHLQNRQTLYRDLSRIWPTLRLGVLTTCTGYLALLLTDFNGLTQLAVFSISGLLSAALFTRWVLPCLLSMGNQQIQDTISSKWLMPFLKPPKASKYIAYGTGALSIVFLFATKQNLWENDIAAMSPVAKADIAADKQLRSAMKVADFSHLLILKAASIDGLLEKGEVLSVSLQGLVDKKDIQDFDILSRYLPSVSTQQNRQRQLPTSERLTRDLDKALSGLLFKQDIFEAFVNDVNLSAQYTPLSFSQLRQSTLGVRLGSLVLEKEDASYGLIPLTGVKDGQVIKQWLAVQGRDDLYYMNIKEATNRMLAGFRHTALDRMQWGVLAILLVLWLGLRRISRLVVVVVPIFSAIFLTISVLLLMGHVLSLFHLIALLLVFGIGVDYSLFFNRQDKEKVQRLQTLKALLICATSTIAVFAILSLSEIPVLHDMGQTVAIGVIACFFLSMAVSQTAEATS